MNKHSMLLIEEAAPVSLVLNRILNYRYRIESTTSFDQALEACRRTTYDLLLADAGRRANKLKDFLERMQDVQTNLLARCLVTSAGQERPVVRLICAERGVAFLSKPFDVGAMRQCLDRLTEDLPTPLRLIN